MAVIKCSFGTKDGRPTVTTAVSQLTKGDKIVFDPKDKAVVVDPSSGVVDLVVNHPLNILVTEDDKGKPNEKLIVSFDPVGGGGAGDVNP